MKRPSLTPMTHSDLEPPPPRRRGARRSPVRLLMVTFLRLLKLLLRVAVADVRTGQRVGLGRVGFGLVRTLALLPAGLLLVAPVIVWQHTRPIASPTDERLTLPDIYTERLTLIAADGTTLAASYVPATSAQSVLSGGEKALRTKSPGVVLVHDAGHDRRQVLPVARRLHAAGYAVVALDCRASGRSEGTSVSYGIDERLDVAAAVRFLAERPGVDATRIAVWGVGTGAVAADLAAGEQPVAALILESEPTSVDGRLLAPLPQSILARPACRWIFDAAFPPPPPGNGVSRSITLRDELIDADQAVAFLNTHLRSEQTARAD